MLAGSRPALTEGNNEVQGLHMLYAEGHAVASDRQPSAVTSFAKSAQLLNLKVCMVWMACVFLLENVT